MQIMCSCSGRVVWCSWIRCLPRRGIRCQRANSFTCNIFVMYFLWNCKVFVQHLQNIWEIFVKYFQQPCTIGSVGSGGAQEGDPVSHRPFNNCSCSSFHQKMSRVFNVFVMHFNVFAYHLYDICKVFLSICRVKWSSEILGTLFVESSTLLSSQKCQQIMEVFFTIFKFLWDKKKGAMPSKFTL